MGLFKDTFGAVSDWTKANKEEKYAKQAAKDADRDYWARIDAMNFDSAKPSETAPQFQATVSPVARSYLESFLTGANPDAIQSTRTGSSGRGGAKATANANFDRLYGSWDKLKTQGDAELSAPDRFAVKPITKKVINEDTKASVKNPQVAPLETALGRPLTAEENEYLNKVWKLDQSVQPGKNINGALLLKLPKAGIERLLRERPADNDVDRLYEYAGK